MNLILFTPEELEAPVPIDDPRIEHVLKTIGTKPGEAFDIGFPNGPRGKATIVEVGDAEVTLETAMGDEPAPLHPIILLCSYVRPTAAGRILREMTTLGVSEMIFFTGEKAEKSYASSKLWQDEEYRRLLHEGAEQAFCTRMPDVYLYETLWDVVPELPDSLRLACDNYESTARLADVAIAEKPVVVAIGPERGWSGPERDYMRSRRFTLVNMGERPLRTDTACIAAVSQLIGRLG